MSGTEPLYLGLPWPAAYRDLKPLILDRWEVEGDIYLGRQLSGKSGAFVYAADLTCRDFTGQAILKFDQAPEPASQEDDEATRHRRAFDRQPDYGAQHLPRVLHTLHHGQSVATLSTIAGRGLIYAIPWQLCPHDQQLDVARRLSKGLIEDWNVGYELSAGMLRPQDLLRQWLGERLDPETGKIFEFLPHDCGISVTEPSVIFRGAWYPNPLAFALMEADRMERLSLRAVMGNVHGDLNGYNVLVGGRDDDDQSYYLIDLAQYEDSQYLFFDNEYFGFSHLLNVRELADAAHWDSLLAHVSHRKHAQRTSAMRGDDLGPIAVVQALRQEILEWVDRHQADRLSFMDDQLILSSVAVGLNFAGKGIDGRLRRLGFLYAAACLRSYMELHDLDWPRHGPQLTLNAADPSSAVGGRAKPAVDDAHPELPEKPAIAVLAFDNLSGDPGQDYFADGVTEEISTMLSSVDWLMVISRGSTFAYKGLGVPIKQIAKELGVHYVVEGSVRKSDDKVRVTAQLTDAIDGHLLWSERYGRDLGDIFDLQEEIAEAIATNIDVELKMAEGEHAVRKRAHIGVWDKFQKGMWHFFKFTDEDSAAAVTQLGKLVTQVPSFAPAQAVLSLLETRQLLLGGADNEVELIERAKRHATNAVAADDRNSYAHMALARVLLLQGEHERAIEHGRIAIELNPSSSGARLTLGHALVWQGDAEEGLSAFDMSLRLSPKGPLRDFKLMGRAFALYLLNRLSEAEQAARKVADGNRAKIGGLLILAAVLARQDRLDEAASVVQELMSVRPNLSLSRMVAAWRGMAGAKMDRFVLDLRKAGVPD